MTTRTVSLLLLFTTALLASGVLLALALRALEGTPASGPWLVPVTAFVCQVIALYLGRTFVLPQPLASSAWRSAGWVIVIVATTMLLAGAVMWVLQSLIGGAVARPALTLGLWFLLLWMVFNRRKAAP